MMPASVWGTPSTRWLLSTALQIIVLLLLSQRSSDRAFKVQPYIIEDPFFEFPTPKIRWIDPRTLVPHEHTSAAHLAALLTHLYTLPPTSPLPIPVCTQSEPPIILDGHHRVASSIALGLTRIPVWVVDDDEENRDWDNALIKVYARSDGSRMRLAEVVEGARGGRVEWGIKGTRHVAVVSSDGKEVTLERVTPRVLWGVWASGGRPCGRFWRDWDKRFIKPNGSISEQEKSSKGEETPLELPDLALDSTAEIMDLPPLVQDVEAPVAPFPPVTTPPTSSTGSIGGMREMLQNLKATVSASLNSLLSSLSASVLPSTPSARSQEDNPHPNHTISLTASTSSSALHFASDASPPTLTSPPPPPSTATLLSTASEDDVTKLPLTSLGMLSLPPIQTIVASLYGAVSSLAFTVVASASMDSGEGASALGVGRTAPPLADASPAVLKGEVAGEGEVGGEGSA
ncbi:hypothetical protein HDU67_006116 [Dinochytrium kinnereticum]|nr:hypothetical protein HDU67_006116 [Dinochytrium kinnereticum]